jgi:hypothetical protein
MRPCLSASTVVVGSSGAVRRLVIRIRTLSSPHLRMAVIRTMGREMQDGGELAGEQEHEQQERALHLADVAKGPAAVHVMQTIAQVGRIRAADPESSLRQLFQLVRFTSPTVTGRMNQCDDGLLIVVNNTTTPSRFRRFNPRPHDAPPQALIVHQPR